MVNESKALTVREPGSLALETLGDLERFGKIMFESGMFADIKSAAAAVVKIAYGKELGIPAITAMVKIHFFSGKPTMSAEVMGALIKRSGEWDYEPLVIENDRCEIQFLKHGKPYGPPSVFTTEDAKRAGVTGKDNWQKYPKNMLFARALSNGARWHCPHVIGGAYVPEELDAPIDDEGNLIVPREKTKPVVTVVSSEPTPVVQSQPVPIPSPERAQIMDDIRAGVGTLHWDSATLRAEIQKIRADVTRVSDLNDNELQELKANVNSAVDAKTTADEELRAASGKPTPV